MPEGRAVPTPSPAGLPRESTAPDLGGAEALVMVGASERSADLLYASAFRAPDPFVFVWTERERLVMVSDLELDRARRQAAVGRVVASSHYERQLQQAGQERPGFDALLVALLQDLGVRSLLLPAEFPFGTSEHLRQAGLALRPAPTPLFSARQRKSADEVALIEKAMRAGEAGLQAAVDAIGAADVRAGVLHWKGEALTSERLRRLIHRVLLEHDCVAQHTIVAGGEQGCDPHHEGSGPLGAGESIILDIFPQTPEGYFGDITRTVVKGKAPAPLVRLFETVLAGQRLALEMVRAGADGRQLHAEVVRAFEAAGYRTAETDGHMQGFFHGTGHGVGLEIHEPPRLGLRGDLLEAGHVVTVEPGLYYPGVGGVRLEDTVVVRPDGCQNLARFPKFLEV
ncbi:MAG: Xaa-Pro peptidase family protein [Candidatus Latescibacterota bacterium]